MLPSRSVHDPKPHYAVALEGFSAFERGALSSFFRLAGQRQPSYVHVKESSHGDFLIADADHAATLDAVQRAGRVADTVFVGSRAPDGAMAWLGRPIDPMHIVRELDSLVARRTSASAAAGNSAGLNLRLLDIDLSISLTASSAPPATGRADAPRDALVVDDSAIARKFLEQRLQRLGYRVFLAATGEQAIELLARQAFAVVFVDVVLGAPGNLDGLQLCQHIRQRVGSRGGKAPAVVIVSGRVTETARVRGLLAGCDAYLSKPMLEDEFIATLRAVDPPPGRAQVLPA